MLRFLLRVLIAAVVLAALAVAGYRMSAFQRETRSADDLMLDGSVFTDTAHGRIHSLAEGPEGGPPVLLIHGSIGWSGFWSDTMTDLANRGYRAIAIDLPPMGLSDRSLTMDYSRQAQALRILAFVEAADIRPVIVAHSIGAAAAAEAFLADPEAFQGAVIVAGGLMLGEDGSARQLPWPLRPVGMREAAIAATVTNPHLNRWLFGRFVHRRSAVTDDHIASVRYPYTRKNTTETLARLLPTLILPPKGAASTDPARYAGLDIPVALIWGREDSVTPPDQAVALQRAMGQAALYWLEDVGHMPQVEAPEDFHNALAKALAGLADPT